VSLYCSQKDCGTAHMGGGEDCMGLCGKCHGDINKATEPRFSWLSLCYGSTDNGEEGS